MRGRHEGVLSRDPIILALTQIELSQQTHGPPRVPSPDWSKRVRTRVLLGLPSPRPVHVPSEGSGGTDTRGPRHFESVAINAARQPGASLSFERQACQASRSRGHDGTISAYNRATDSDTPDRWLGTAVVLVRIASPATSGAGDRPLAKQPGQCEAHMPPEGLPMIRARDSRSLDSFENGRTRCLPI